MDLRKTLLFTHELLTKKEIDHALIGGMALATLGLNRATSDVDFMIDEVDKEVAKNELIKNGFQLVHESVEVLQFSGIGYLDILLARRPISRAMLARAATFDVHQIKCLDAEDIIGLKIQAYKNDPERELQDKADIQGLIKNANKSLDWERLKLYAELFSEWEFLKKYREN